MSCLVWWLLCDLNPAVAGSTRLSQAEVEQLQTGEVVVREASGWTTVAVEIDATPEEVMAAVLAVDARVGDVGAVKKVEVYLDQPGRRGVRMTVGAAGMELVVHLLFEYDAATGLCRYRLDEAQKNDADAMDGTYTLEPTDGGTRLVLLSRSDVGPVPGWLQAKFEKASLVEQLESIRARAEALIP